MKIIDHAWKWTGRLTKRVLPVRYIVLHHAAAHTASPEDVDRWHKSRGWSGIGYHFYVRKDGSIHRGRPLDCVGAHVAGKNSYSVGICAEGDFTRETMAGTQKDAMRGIVAWLQTVYPKAKVVRHADLAPTSCPGGNYPLAFVTSGAPAAPKPNTRPDIPTLRIGATGSFVKLLQHALIKRGYKLTVDGIFGPKTRKAVMAYQKRCHMGVDGIVGPKTWRALGF